MLRMLSAVVALSFAVSTAQARPVPMETLASGHVVVAEDALVMDGFVLPFQRVVPGELAVMLSEVRAELRAGGRYAGLDRERRKALDRGLADMTRLLDGRASASDLDPNQEVRLLNAWFLANAALADREFDPIICRREAVVGSRVREVRCAHESGLRERARLEREERRKSAPLRGSTFLRGG